MKKAIVALLLSAFAVTPALADNTGKFYIAGDIGSARYTNVTVAAGTYPNPGMVRIAGGYHYSPALAVELGVSGFGDSTLTTGVSSGTITASSFQIAAVGSLPLNSQFDLFGKLGIAANKNQIDVKISGFTVASVSSSKSSLLVGFGAQYHINSQFSVRAQYENFGSFGNFGTTGQDMKASAISAGVAYDF